VAPGHSVSYASTNRSAVRFWKTRVSRQTRVSGKLTTRASLALPRLWSTTRIERRRGRRMILVRPLVVLVGFRKNPSTRRDARTTTNVLRQRIPVSRFRERRRLGDLTRATPRAATGRQQGEARNGHTREIALIVNAVLPCSQRVASRVIFPSRCDPGGLRASARSPTYRSWTFAGALRYREPRHQHIIETTREPLTRIQT